MAPTFPHDRIPATLVDLLRLRAAQRPDRRAYTWLNEHCDETDSFTYAGLERKSKAIAALLQERDMRGKPVLLLYPPGLDFVAAFYGCLYAGSLAVPAYPPRPNQFGSRLTAICAETRTTLALTTSSIASKSGMSAQLAGLEWIATDEVDLAHADFWQDPNVTADTIAFLQFTSGSTSAPKGVVVSHGNLIYNQRMIELAFEHSETSVVLGWLPLYHDMGLIGNVMQPLWMGIPCILMSPLDFLLKPYRWLQAITRYRATTSGAPDFAYDLCVRRITPEQRQTLDLGTWDLAYNGAEPIRAKTVESFTKTFAPHGFRAEAFYPCYGLAEATLLVSGGKKSGVPVTEQVEERTLIGCGEPKLEERIVVVDPESCIECPPGKAGEIWVSGPNVCKGYWNRPDATAETFGAHVRDTGEGPFLRTGDLGFLQNGELFVQGRLKDTIIVRGMNHYPQDIEHAVQQSNPAFRPHCGAAFAVDVEGEEKVVVVQEVDREHYRRLDPHALVADARQAVADAHGLQVHAVSLIKAGSIPRTSSGKVQRFKCRKDFLEGTLELLADSGTRARGEVTHV